MAPFNNTSALKGLDANNVNSLRRLMNAIMHRLAGVSAATIQEIDNLTMQEHATMLYLTENARDNELLSRMVTRFASARYANSNTVREAGRELDLVVTEAVLEPRNRPERELVMAEGFFNHLVAESPATYGVGAENEYGDIEPDDDDEDEEKGKKDKKDPNVSFLSLLIMLVSTISPSKNSKTSR